MSDELNKKISDLTAENEKLKQEIAQGKAGIDGLTSQLDAHREQLNESLNIGLTMRTNVIHLKKQYQNLCQEHDNLKRTLSGVNKQLEDATKRIADFEAAQAGQVANA